jgi:4-amino-4-deoxy-L-arabinose transferase-like glycosyltransferase
MDGARGERWAVGALAVAVLAARAWAAGAFGLLADEAYHWTWSLSPALGYYDQPPLVAWLLALGRALGGDTPLALRLPGLVLAAAGWAALVRHARDAGTFTRLFLGLPALAFLGSLAVPDAALLGCWALATAAALAGGRGWWAAGALAGAATLAKHEGALLLPALLAAAPERRTRDPWLGVLAYGVVVAPHLAWLAAHDLAPLRFQLGENLLHPRPPGVWGPVRWLAEQAGLALVLPAAALPVAAARAWRSGDRGGRLLVASCVPVAVAFLAASPFGPPEAHWPAPAWVAGSVLLARLQGRWGDVAAVGSWLGLFATLALGVHVAHPLVDLPVDPAVRFGEGRVLADAVAREALPEGVGPREPRARAVSDVFTERYQEAALIAFHTGIPARVYPGCGRPSQYDLGPAPVVGDALWFVRSRRSGPTTCVPGYGGRGRVIREADDRGRAVPPFEIFRLERLP